MENQSKEVGFSYVKLVVAIVVALAFFSGLAYTFLQTKQGQEEFDQTADPLRVGMVQKVSIEAELYADDHGGKYPESLGVLAIDDIDAPIYSSLVYTVSEDRTEYVVSIELSDSGNRPSGNNAFSNTLGADCFGRTYCVSGAY